MVDKEAEIEHWKRMYADLESVVLAISGDRQSINRHMAVLQSAGVDIQGGIQFSQPLNICMKSDVDRANKQAHLLREELDRATGANPSSHPPSHMSYHMSSHPSSHPPSHMSYHNLLAHSPSHPPSHSSPIIENHPPLSSTYSRLTQWTLSHTSSHPPLLSTYSHTYSTDNTTHNINYQHLLSHITPLLQELCYLNIIAD